MTEAQKTKLKRALIIAASVLLIVYIVYQAYMVIYDPVETELAYEYTIEDVVDTDIFAVRSESFIINKNKGTIIPAVDDGSKVAKDQEIALIFTDTTAADNYLKLEDLEEQIERYTRLAAQTDNYLFSVSDLDLYIDNAVTDIVNMTDDKNFSQLDNNVNELRNQIVTRQIATGNTFDFDSKLASYQAQYDALKNKNTSHKSITASTPGYYVSGGDGYEKTIDYTKVAELTVDDIEKALKATPSDLPENSIGKLVTEFTWYCVCAVESERVGSLEVGDTITVKLPYSAVNSVKAEVVAINGSNDEEDVALVLSCNLMNEDIATLRQETAQIVVKSYDGIKIPSSAIRVNEDDEKGVLVQSGNILKFKKIDVIYTTKDYVLSEIKDSDDSYVGLYDSIVTGGKDLYDGKVIK